MSTTAERLQQEEQKLAELQKRLESIQLQQQLNAHIPPDFLDAVRRALRGTGDWKVSGFADWRDRLHDMAKAQREAKRLKAYQTGTTTLGEQALVGKYLAHQAVPEFLQYYFPSVTLRGSEFAVEGYFNSSGTATAWTEGNNKATASRVHYRNVNGVTHIAITELYSQRVVDFLGDAAIQGMALDLLMWVEEAIHNAIFTSLLGISVAFPAATYTATVPSATWVDTLALAIAHDSYPQVLLSEREGALIDVVILPRQYYMLFPVTPKTSFGQRLYADWETAFNLDPVEVTFQSFSAPNNVLGMFLRSQTMFYGTGDTLQVHSDRVVDQSQDQNWYRITLEIPFVFNYLRRINLSTAQGYVMTAHLVNDTATINV